MVQKGGGQWLNRINEYAHVELAISARLSVKLVTHSKNRKRMESGVSGLKSGAPKMEKRIIDECFSRRNKR